MNIFMVYAAVALLLGYVLDLKFGDPYFRFHPICLIGNLISFYEKRLYGQKNKRVAGRWLVVLTLLTVALVVGSLEVIAYLIHPVVFVFVEGVLLWFAFAQTSLQKESLKVYQALLNGSLKDARYAVSMIVGRDTEVLDETGVTKAAVETVAENTSDGIIAPLFYAGLLGGLGAYIYKAVNTMDSMVGYKNEKYMDFGRCAAKVDDVVNFIPARLSGIFMILAAKVCGLDWKNAAKIFKRDRFNHASPNSAQTESACAGALNIQLAGDAWYGGVLFKKKFIGDPNRPVVYEDIPRACHLMKATCMLFLLPVALVLILKIGLL